MGVFNKILYNKNQYQQELSSLQAELKVSYSCKCETFQSESYEQLLALNNRK